MMRIKGDDREGTLISTSLPQGKLDSMNETDRLPEVTDPPSREEWEFMMRNTDSRGAISLRLHALYRLSRGNMRWLEYISLAERVMHERCIRF
jgi:hypothetical protein